MINYSTSGALIWNALVAYVSGGLLYGREVDRPAGMIGTAKRKKRVSKAKAGNLGSRRAEMAKV